MNKKFSLPRGTADILPQDIALWQDIETKARSLLTRWGYAEIRTPFFEETELFRRSMGQTSDIVQKQMLNLAHQDRNQLVTGVPEHAFTPVEIVNYSLRPEGTASIVRSYIQNDLDKKEALSKLFYIGPMFRGERPQKGRLRQFHQIGAEAIGPNSALPLLDAEMIALSVNLLKETGLPEKLFQLKLNTLGSKEDKENFSKFLREKLTSQKTKLCTDCQNRFERNVFRILDCKNRDCRAVVASLKLDHSYLSPESRRYFSEVCVALDSLKIPYEMDFSLVRGLDYYTQTVFEISSPGLGSQDALGAGGRYGGLVQELGGAKEVDAIGFALGIERIILALGEIKIATKPLDAFFVSLDEASLKKNFIILQQIRKAGFSADMNYRLASMKSQMRLADKMKTRYVIILGEEELGKGVVTVKNMETGNQDPIPLSDIKLLIEKLNG